MKVGLDPPYVLVGHLPPLHVGLPSPIERQLLQNHEVQHTNAMRCPCEDLYFFEPVSHDISFS